MRKPFPSLLALLAVSATAFAQPTGQFSAHQDIGTVRRAGSSVSALASDQVRPRDSADTCLRPTTSGRIPPANPTPEPLSYDLRNRRSEVRILSGALGEGIPPSTRLRPGLLLVGAKGLPR